ncbi:hypothetical protein AAVH_42307, partial [Aphelenchoides avenae]
APRLDDINIDVKAVDNSHHGVGAGHAGGNGGFGGEEAERLKRQANPLNAINIAVNAVDNSKHGSGHGGRGAGGHQQSGPVEQPEPETPASEEAERLKRQAPRLDDINIDIKAEDNSRHGHSGGEEGQRLKRQAPTRLDDINIKVNAVDNSRHGAGAGHGGAAGDQEEPEGEEAGRLARRG